MSTKFKQRERSEMEISRRCLLQRAEDVGDLPVDLGELLVDRRQIHPLLRGSHAKTLTRAAEGTGKIQPEMDPRGDQPEPNPTHWDARIGGVPAQMRRGQPGGEDSGGDDG